MKRVRLAMILFLPLLSGGCLALPVVEESVYSPCRAIASSGWSAHVERIPDHHNRPVLKPTLIVAGRVTVPGAGYDVALELGPVQKLNGAVQQILLRATPPPGEATGAPTTLDVSGAFPARKSYAAVTIRCGDGTMAIIKPVPRSDVRAVPAGSS
ncbi:MAG: hypothetical protein QOH81_1030 [Sphingomonadales bacterium]|jgi:hypothetical protein|nr:hypothetical protein [Sphingomonadales bacterium]